MNFRHIVYNSLFTVVNILKIIQSSWGFVLTTPILKLKKTNPNPRFFEKEPDII